MDKFDIMHKISELEREIAALPPGSLTTKRVKGKEYFYHRYTVNGNRHEDYIDFEAVDILRDQIEKRKTLEAEQKRLKQSMPKTATTRRKAVHEFRTVVRTGRQLENWAIHSASKGSHPHYLQLSHAAVIPIERSCTKWV